MENVENSKRNIHGIHPDKLDLTKIISEEWLDDNVESRCKYGINNPNSLIFMINTTKNLVLRFEDYIIKIASNYGVDKISTDAYKYEFINGKVINKIKSPHLIETLGYIERGKNFYNISRYINGIPLNSYSIDKDLNKVIDKIIHLLYIIVDLQLKHGFTHYDLHAGNILVVPTEEEVTYNYKYFNNENVTITTKENIVIIDLEWCHLNDTPEGYYDLEIPYKSINPGVFDPLIDISKIMEFLVIISRDIINYNKHLLERFHIIKELLVRNEIYTLAAQKESRIHDIYSIFIYSKGIYAAKSGSKYTLDEFQKMFKDKCFNRAFELGADIDHIHKGCCGTDDDSILCELHELIYPIQEDFYKEGELEEYRKELGRCLYDYSTNMIKSRPCSNEDIVFLLFELVGKIKETCT